VTQPASTSAISKLSEVKKAVINVLTLIVAIGGPTLDYLGVIHVPGNTVLIFSTVVAVAGSVLHYLVPNTTTSAAVAQANSVKLVAPRVAA
jgi:hypothetical protein